MLFCERLNILLFVVEISLVELFKLASLEALNLFNLLLSETSLGCPKFLIVDLGLLRIEEIFKPGTTFFSILLTDNDFLSMTLLPEILASF